MPDLQVPVSQARLAVVDVETTGLWAEQGHRVCQIAVLRVERSQVLDAFQSYVQPGRDIDEDARRVNGIDDADLADAPTFQRLIARLDGLLDDAVLVAHNAPFDASFLVAEYTIAGASLPQVPVLDTLALSRRLLRRRRNDLGSVAEALDVPLGTRHRALDDARTTLGVLQRMAHDFARRGLATVADLLSAQRQNVDLLPPRLGDLPQPLAEAVRSRHPVTICYVDAGGNVTERTVQPLWANPTYLIAWCHRQKAQRTFRVDRIVDAWLS